MIRTTRPTAGNKYFNTKSNGGYSTCIKGKPTDSQCDVLSNCVGYANGAFNEECDLGYEKYHLNCNAENFIERAIASGLSVVSKPVVGSIICWQKGETLKPSDGAGHVAIVVDVINDNCIKTAESGYGRTTPFWITVRYNNNGRWGLTDKYKLRGFIVNPNYPPQPEPQPTPPEPPKPEPTKLKVGDKVKIVKTGRASSYGDKPTAGGVGWTREILKIYSGRPYPYRVGNKTGTTGFYKSDALKKL